MSSCFPPHKLAFPVKAHKHLAHINISLRSAREAMSKTLKGGQALGQSPIDFHRLKGLMSALAQQRHTTARILCFRPF